MSFFSSFFLFLKKEYREYVDWTELFLSFRTTIKLYSSAINRSNFHLRTVLFKKGLNTCRTMCDHVICGQKKRRTKNKSTIIFPWKIDLELSRFFIHFDSFRTLFVETWKVMRVNERLKKYFRKTKRKMKIEKRETRRADARPNEQLKLHSRHNKK